MICTILKKISLSLADISLILVTPSVDQLLTFYRTYWFYSPQELVTPLTNTEH